MLADTLAAGANNTNFQSHSIYSSPKKDHAYEDVANSFAASTSRCVTGRFNHGTRNILNIGSIVTARLAGRLFSDRSIARRGIEEPESAEGESATRTPAAF